MCNFPYIGCCFGSTRSAEAVLPINPGTRPKEEEKKLKMKCVLTWQSTIGTVFKRKVWRDNLGIFFFWLFEEAVLPAETSGFQQNTSLLNVVVLLYHKSLKILAKHPFCDCNMWWKLLHGKWMKLLKQLSVMSKPIKSDLDNTLHFAYKAHPVATSMPGQTKSWGIPPPAMASTMAAPSSKHTFVHIVLCGIKLNERENFAGSTAQLMQHRTYPVVFFWEEKANG